MLVLAAGRSSELDALLSEAIEFEDLKYGPDPATNLPEEDARNHLAYLTTESQVLLHHTAEALVRLFLGHAELPLCPWFECARLTKFWEFRDKAAKLAAADDKDTRDAISNVFLGEPEADLDEDKRDGLEATIRLLRALIGRLASDKGIYNSAKHGMTIFPSQAHVLVRSQEGDVVLNASGPSIAYLEFEKRDGGIAWHEKTTWLSIRQALYLTELTISQMDLLWGIAKARYLNESQDGLRIVTQEAVKDALRPAPSHGLTNLRRFIAFENRG
jgi:hypothetical protein